MSTQTQVNSFFTPTQISGCQLWLDAADTNTVTLSGTNVIQWRDKSAQKFVASNIGGVTTRTLNGQNALYMPQTRMIISNFSQTLYSTTFFVANAQTANFMLSLATFSTYIYTANYSLYYFTGGVNSIDFKDSVNTLGTPVVSANANFLLSIGYGGGTNTSVYSVNGTQRSATAYLGVAQSNTTLTNALYINGNPSGSITDNSVVAELIIYNAVLTLAQAQQVEGYLAWKWGLQANLPSNHPYKTSPFPPLLSPPRTLPLVLPATFQPTQISGLSLWLDASDTATITGTSPITGWTDKSGTGKTITFVGTNNTYNSTTQSVNTSNGSGATSTYFYANLNLKRSVVPNVSVFMVYTWTGSGINENQALWGQDNGGGWNRFQLLSFPTTPAIAYGLSYVPASPYVTVASALNTANKLVYTATYAINATNGTFVNVNGALASSLVTEVAASPETTTTNTYFGSIDTGYSGRVAFHEIIIYTANLSIDQRQQVEGYLAWKWNLTSSFSSTFPYKTFQPSLSLPVNPRSVAVANTWNPTSFTGCELWLDGQDRSSMVISGNTVTQWNDKSGNNRNGVATGAPTLTTTTNKRQAISFGGSDFFKLTNNISTFTRTFMTWFIIASATTDGRNLMTMFGNERSVTFQLYYNSQVGNMFYSPSRPYLNTNGMFCIVENVGVRAAGFINGTGNAAMTQNSASITNAATEIVVGATGSYTNGWIGNIQETIVYNVALTTAQRQQVEGYLAWKWGIQSSLPSNHPWKNWPPAP